MGIADDGGIDYITMAEYPHSLGLFYSTLTSFLGFKPNEGEYKVMGLAPYGDPEKYIENVRKLIKYDNNSLKCNMDVFCWDKSTTEMFNYKLLELLKIDPRVPDSEITEDHKNLAAAVQKRYEEILFDVIKSVSLIDENSNLCLSGGCAYNGTANGKIISNTHFNNLWIPLAPSDAGSSIGACVNYLIQTDNTFKGKVTKNPFLGPDYDYDKVIKSINPSKVVKYNSEEELLSKVAEEIHNEKVIGWFYGNIEFGARALGNRSILASPIKVEMKDKDSTFFVLARFTGVT
jgi:carbamoyltransferase